VIDDGCCLSFDLVEPNLPVPFIRGIRKGFVLIVTQILLPQKHRAACGKELLVQILLLPG